MKRCNYGQYGVMYVSILLKMTFIYLHSHFLTFETGRSIFIAACGFYDGAVLRPVSSRWYMLSIAYPQHPSGEQL